MTKIQRITVVFLAAALPMMAQAETRIYAYESKANYCPNGLQPITLNGVICCGTPNQTASYQDMMAHASGARRSYTMPASKGMVCPEGEKGCYTE